MEDISGLSLYWDTKPHIFKHDLPWDYVLVMREIAVN
jgi:hypothetical protein